MPWNTTPTLPKSSLNFVGKPLAQVTVDDIQAWAETLRVQAPATRANRLAVVKSLFGIAHSLGYIPFNPAGVVKLPKVKCTLAGRILAEGDVHRLLALEPQPRNRASTAPCLHYYMWPVCGCRNYARLNGKMCNRAPKGRYR